MRARCLLTGVVGLFLIGMMASSSYAIIDPETIAGMWLFDEGEGDTARDSSANGNDGEISGATWVDDGKFDKALDFDGVDDNVNCGSHASLDLTDAITIMAWAKLDEVNQYAAIVEKRLCGTNNGYALLNGWDRNTYMELTSLGIWIQGGVLETDRWYHFAATWDSATGDVRFYQDGVLVQSKTQGAGGEIVLNTEPLLIGLRGRVCTGNFDGIIDEVAVFNVALEEGDIQAIANEGLKAATGIIAVSSIGKLTTTWGSVRTIY